MIEGQPFTAFPSFEDVSITYTIITIGRVSLDKTITVSPALSLTFFHYLISGFSTAFTPHSTEWKYHYFSDLLCLVFFLAFHTPCLSPQILTLAPYIGEGNGTPLQYSCLENPMEGGTW